MWLLTRVPLAVFASIIGVGGNRIPDPDIPYQQLSHGTNDGVNAFHASLDVVSLMQSSPHRSYIGDLYRAGGFDYVSREGGSVTDL
jgi:hypothetical protein